MAGRGQQGPQDHRNYYQLPPSSSAGQYEPLPAISSPPSGSSYPVPDDYIQTSSAEVPVSGPTSYGFSGETSYVIPYSSPFSTESSYAAMPAWSSQMPIRNSVSSGGSALESAPAYPHATWLAMNQYSSPEDQQSWRIPTAVTFPPAPLPPTTPTRATSSSVPSPTNSNHSNASSPRSDYGQNPTPGNNDRPFQCDLCSLAFKRRNNLETHRSTQHNPNPRRYYCDVPGCDPERRGFQRTQDLQRHTNSIHLNIRYPCDDCGRSFPRMDSLRRHRETRGACPSRDGIRVDRE